VVLILFFFLLDREKEQVCNNEYDPFEERKREDEKEM